MRIELATFVTDAAEGGRVSKIRINSKEPVKSDEQGCFRINAHERDKTSDKTSDKTTKFYRQVAFRIVEPEPFAEDELEVRIVNDRRMADAVEEKKLTLNHDSYDDNGERQTWWYQNTTYDSDGRPNKHDVDSITTAGVFRVCIRNRETSEVLYTSPWIYVLPKAVSVDDYKKMLCDLISMHDSLVIRDDSTVGIGMEISFEQALLKRQAAEFENQIRELNRLLRKIEKQPQVLLKKKYGKVNPDKLRRFDAHIIRDYARHGGVGKISQVDYDESPDIYENRVIKAFVERLQTWEFNADAVKARYEHSEVDEERIIKLIECEKTPTIYCYKEPSRCYDNIREVLYVFVKQIVYYYNDDRSRGIDYKIGFSYILSSKPPNNEDDSLNGGEYFEFRSNSQYNVIRFLRAVLSYNDNRIELMSLLRNAGIKFKCKLLIYNINKSSYYGICQIDDQSQNETYEDFYSDIYHIYRNYEGDIILNVHDSDYIRMNIRFIKENAEKISKVDINSEISKAIESAKSYIDNEKNSIEKVSWFNKVNSEAVKTLPPKPTPIFMRDNVYHKIYDLIKRMTLKYPLLSGEFDVNAFGVRDTYEVYEYWVFYKILSRLTELGFRPKDENFTTELGEKIRDWIANRGKLEGFHIELVKQTCEKNITVIFFYNYKFNGKFKKFNSEEFDEDSGLKPDFAFYFKETRHIYFFDAKYREYDTKYLKNEVRNVAVEKYIYGLNQIFCDFLSTENKGLNDIFCNSRPIINGSYLLIAKYSEDNKEEVLSDDQLFTATEWLKEDYILNKIDYCKPHQIGAVELTPSNFNMFNSLLKLIFEYKEKLIGRKSKAVCWECGNIDADRIVLPTDAGYPKYYVFCGKCGEFRVETHCCEHKGDHRLIKHTRDNYHTIQIKPSDKKMPYFFCPYCKPPQQ